MIFFYTKAVFGLRDNNEKKGNHMDWGQFLILIITVEECALLNQE